MGWFRWKGKQEPWGDNFSVVEVALPATSAGEAKRYTVPYDQHLQLIGCGIELNPGVLPSAMWAYIYARRGGRMLHYTFTNLQGPVVGVSRGWVAVGLTRSQDRSALPRAQTPLSDYFYLYPHDDVIIDIFTAGGATWTLEGCSFTFKQWLSS